MYAVYLKQDIRITLNSEQFRRQSRKVGQTNPVKSRYLYFSDGSILFSGKQGLSVSCICQHQDVTKKQHGISKITFFVDT